MAPYTEQVLLCTGKDDWTSRIEDEESASGDFVRGLKGEIGRGGKGFDVCLFPVPTVPMSIQRQIAYNLHSPLRTF